MDMPGAASAGPAGKPEMDYNLGGYDAWDAPEVPEQFGDVAADGGPPPGADDPALAMQAGASAKESDRAPAQHSESALICFMEADAQLRQHAPAETAMLPDVSLKGANILGSSSPRGVPLMQKCLVWPIDFQFLQAARWIW